MHSPSHRITQSLLLVGVLATGVSQLGCGLKGALYKPGERQQQRTQPAATPAKAPMSDKQPAPQAQKKGGDMTSSDAPTIDPDRPADPAPGTP